VTLPLARAVGSDAETRERLLRFLDDAACTCRYSGRRGELLTHRCERCVLIFDLTYSNLRSHELPRNSGEVAAVDGPTTLAGGDDALEQIE
jgi:hypothetical protein